jgi:hypothetical protein
MKCRVFRSFTSDRTHGEATQQQTRRLKFLVQQNVVIYTGTFFQTERPASGTSSYLP